MDIGVLGPLRVFHGGRSLDLGPPRNRTVMGVLIARANNLVGVSSLVDELWPQSPPADARTLVHGYISRLRRALGPVAKRLVSRKPGYMLTIGEGELDLDRFLRAAAQARRLREAGELDRSVAEYRAAQQLWLGPAYADVTASPAIAAAVTRLTELRLSTLDEMFETCLAAGQSGELVAELTEVVGEHPLRERFVGHLMLAQHRAGRTADALSTYRTAKTLLADELGVDPGAYLRELEVRILRDEGSTSVAAAPAAIPARPAQLPADLATFTGRDAELTELLARAENPGEAIVITAVDGMAGIGKTALAIRAAHRLAPRFPDGQLFLDLHGHTRDVEPVDPGDALDRMLRALGISGQEIPGGTDERAALFRSHLSTRRVLLVLDNVADEAQVRPLLPAAPGCLVLISSRRRLVALDNAQPLTLEVLPLPDAVALFTRVSGRGGGNVRDVVELCGRLPLAIRLAAARLRSRPHWSVTDLAARLRDHRGVLEELEIGGEGVATAFHLSYLGLSPAEQRLFGLLGNHPGPDFDAGAATALSGSDERTTRRMLERLVDAHLVQALKHGRYSLHDLLRAHAAATSARDRAALDRLFDYYLTQAAAATGALSPARVEALAFDGDPELWLETERANLLAMANEPGWPAQTCRLSRILGLYLDTRSLLNDGLRLHTAAMRAAESIGDALQEAVARHRLAIVFRRLARYREATNHCVRAAAIYEVIGERGNQAGALLTLSFICSSQGAYPEASRHLERALEIASGSGNIELQSRVLNNLGSLYLDLGRYAEALDWFERALELLRDRPNRISEAITLNNVGTARVKLGHPEAGLPHLEHALVLHRENGDRRIEAESLDALGDAYRRLGRLADSLSYHEKALKLHRETGSRERESATLNHLGETLCEMGRHAEAQAHFRQARQLARSRGERREQARALEGLGELGAAQEIYRELGIHLPSGS